MRDSNTHEQKGTITGASNQTQSEPEIKDITGRSLTANSKPYCTQVPYRDFHHTEDLLQQKIQRLSIQLALVTSPTVQYLHSGGGQTNTSYRIVQNLIHTNKTRESRIRLGIHQCQHPHCGILHLPQLPAGETKCNKDLSVFFLNNCM